MVNKNFMDAYDRVTDAIRHVEATLDHAQFEASEVATDHLRALNGMSDLDTSNVERLDRLCMGCAASREYIRDIWQEMDAMRQRFLGEPPSSGETPRKVVELSVVVNNDREDPEVS